jgi:hypothetical protein
MADILARAHLSRGWHQPEAWGVWSASMYAEVTLPLAADGHGDLKLHLSSRAIIAPGLSDQWIGVSVGGVAVGTLVYPASLSEQCDDFIVPAERVQGDEVVIGFHAARMASPAMVGLSEDKRPLGIGLLAITVSAA